MLLLRLLMQLFQSAQATTASNLHEELRLALLLPFTTINKYYIKYSYRSPINAKGHKLDLPLL
jgi:hypothetical protein